MPAFEADRESLTVFEVGDEYLFAEYFDNQGLFEDLQAYYDGEEYRFEVPAEEFESVRERLEAAYFEPVVVSDLEPYCVVVEKYDEHAEILKRSIATWERRGHRFFLMRDELAVEEALDRDATPVAETEFVVGL